MKTFTKILHYTRIKSILRHASTTSTCCSPSNISAAPHITNVTDVINQSTPHITQSTPHITQSVHIIPQRSSINNAAVTKQRLELFEAEQKRQQRLVTDVEKIKVEYVDQPGSCTLYMNKMMSTPYDCSRHVSQLVGERAVLAEVDGCLWDLHRPLEKDCTLKFLHFKEADPFYVNKAFWRSCSLVLGAVLEGAFKQQHYVQLCSFPAPNVRTGSFVYDVNLGMDWQPTKDEMRVLSSEMQKIALQKFPFQRLVVSKEKALELFQDNVYKTHQIPHIVTERGREEGGDTVTVYRVGNFVDISCGPLIANTGQIGRTTVASVHNLNNNNNNNDDSNNNLTRVQAVALPKEILINHFSYSILEERARSLNEGRLPDLKFMTEGPKTA